MKHRPLRGLSYPDSQACKTASTFPFSTGNTLPAISHHGMCLFRNFIVLVPNRHIVSPKNIQIFFLLCHFQACRLQQKFLLVPVCPTLHYALSHFISFSLLQPKCANSFCTIFCFSCWYCFLIWLGRYHQYLLILNGNSLTNIWNKTVLRLNQKELANFLYPDNSHLL